VLLLLEASVELVCFELFKCSLQVVVMMMMMMMMISCKVVFKSFQTGRLE
jgi:hypothetical protein